MRPVHILRLGICAVTLTLLSFAQAGFAAAPPTCRGVDMLAEMKVKDLASYSQVMAAAKATPNSNKLFWKIETPSAAPSYLLGTVHLTDERVTTLKPSIKTALKSSKRIVLEVADLSEAAMNKTMFSALNLLMFTGKKRLDPLLSKDEFAIVKAAITKMGMPGDMAKRLKPWFATTVMALSPCERARGAAGIKALDQQLAAEAKALGLKVLGVETIKEQFQSMASIPMPDQLEMLKSTIKYYRRTQDLLETMIGIYQRREMGAAWPLQLKLAQLAGADISRFESFRQLLIVKRNTRMSSRVIEHLKKGGTFFAVGALHLPGKEGLVALLRQAGFKVTPAE